MNEAISKRTRIVKKRLRKRLKDLDQEESNKSNLYRKSRLLELPSELRLLIYNQLFPEPLENIFPYIDNQQLHFSLASEKLSILLCCKMLYDECRDRAYSLTVFQVIVNNDHRLYANNEASPTSIMPMPTRERLAEHRSGWAHVRRTKHALNPRLLNSIQAISFFGLAYMTFLDAPGLYPEGSLLRLCNFPNLTTVAIPAWMSEVNSYSYYKNPVENIVNYVPNLSTIVIHDSREVRAERRLTGGIILRDLVDRVDVKFGSQSKCQRSLHIEHAEVYDGDTLAVCIGVVARHPYGWFRKGGKRHRYVGTPPPEPRQKPCLRFPVRHVRIVIGEEKEVRDILVPTWNRNCCPWSNTIKS